MFWVLPIFHNNAKIIFRLSESPYLEFTLHYFQEKMTLICIGRFTLFNQSQNNKL